MPPAGLVAGVCLATFIGSVLLTAALLWAAITGRLGERASHFCSPLARREQARREQARREEADAAACT